MEDTNLLPDVPPSPFPSENRLIEDIYSGNYVLVPPEFLQTFTSFSDFCEYVLSKHLVLTSCTEEHELDRVFELTNDPRFCKALIDPFSESASFGSYRLWAGPKSRAGMRGLTHVTVGSGTRYGRVVSFHQWKIPTPDVEGFTRELLKRKIRLADNGTVSSTLREMLTSSSRVRRALSTKGFPSELLYAALQVFRLGRFEAIRLGKVETRLYDFNSAYPYQVSKLQCALPSYTEWTDASLADLRDPSVCYLFALVDVEVTHYTISPVWYRREGVFGRNLLFPWGEVPGVWMGLHTLKLLDTLGAKITLLAGFTGRVKVPFTPFSSIVEIYESLRGSSLEGQGKSLRGRLTGNFAGTYVELGQSGRVVRRALSTWNPIYGGAVIDAQFAALTEQALLLREGELYRLSVDGLAVSQRVSLPTSSQPGKLRLVEEGTGLIFSDHFMQTSRRSVHWDYDPTNHQIVLPQRGRPALVSSFGSFRSPESQWARFTGSSSREFRFPAGSSKRLHEEIDYMSTYTDSMAPQLSDVASLGRFVDDMDAFLWGLEDG